MTSYRSRSRDEWNRACDASSLARQLVAAEHEAADDEDHVRDMVLGHLEAARRRGNEVRDHATEAEREDQDDEKLAHDEYLFL